MLFRADMDIVGDVRGPMRILQEVGRTKADAVILASTSPKTSGLCSQLLSVYPDLTIFAIGDDLQQGFVEQMRLRRSKVISAKGSDLIDSPTPRAVLQRGDFLASDFGAGSERGLFRVSEPSWGGRPALSSWIVEVLKSSN